MNEVMQEVYCMKGICLFSFVLQLVFLTGCSINNEVLEPSIAYFPQQTYLNKLPSAFPPLTKEESMSFWGAELYLGERFARELDFYRAITAFKRALFLLPSNHSQRQLQLHFNLVECYYLAQKYQDAIFVFEESDLICVDSSFPSGLELLLMLRDSYQKTFQCERADVMLKGLEQISNEAANSSLIGESIANGDICSALALTGTDRDRSIILSLQTNYCSCALSVKKAQLLNAVLPGAGYYYVGQKKTALTSLMINSLFTAATYFFCVNNNIPAGIICASFEMGWYVGGINGAGLAAKEYNEYLYNYLGKDTMVCGRYFPVLHFQTAF